MARPEEDIDPRRVEVDPKRRRRKARNKPAPSKRLTDGKEAARARVLAMPSNPGVKQEPTKGGGYVTTSIHSDMELWELQLAEAFATPSWSLIKTFTDQLRRLAPEVWDDDNNRWKADETVWNAILALVADHQPEKASQAALAAQMAAVHLMMMRLSEQALNRGFTVIEKDASLAAKLARTYSQQCETMLLLKGKRRSVRQTIKVEKTLRQEVHYHDHRTGEVGKTDDQPQETTGADSTEERAALPSLCKVHRLPMSRTGGA